MRRLTTVLAMVGTLGCGACGEPTPYQPAVGGHGFVEQALEENRYRVSFSGNRLTSRDTVENYLLYRAAEITVDEGFDHFLVVERDTERHTVYFPSVPVAGSFGIGVYGADGGGFGGFASGGARSSDRYTSYANIVMRPGPKSDGDPDAYDARSVLQRLAP